MVSPTAVILEEFIPADKAYVSKTTPDETVCSPKEALELVTDKIALAAKNAWDNRKEALYANNNGLEFYEKITEQAPLYLNSKGWLLFELGINQADSVVEYMQKSFTNINIEKDLAGIERVIYGQLRG